MDIFTVGGLPLHPLLVHAVVVLLPLAALATILHALWPAARRRLGFVTPLAALVVLALIPITVAAGDALAPVVGSFPQLDAHEMLGRMLLPWGGALFAVALAEWVWFRFAHPRVGQPNRRAVRTTVHVILAACAVTVSAGAVFLLVLIGDSGARAVWGGILGLAA